jgi:hypothetical protein
VAASAGFDTKSARPRQRIIFISTVQSRRRRKFDLFEQA